MEIYYFSPYKVCYVFGIINGLIIFFLLLILSIIPCNKGFFCSVEYNEQYYFDNIFNFFNENTFAQISLYLFAYITKTVVSILINMVIQSHSICHIFLLYEVIVFIPKIVPFISAILNPKIMVIFISYILEVILVLIFLEKLELNFCGLNKNLKKNIQNRADIEMRDSLILDEIKNNSFFNTFHKFLNLFLHIYFCIYISILTTKQFCMNSLVIIFCRHSGNFIHKSFTC